MFADDWCWTGGARVNLVAIEHGSHNGQEDQDQFKLDCNQSSDGVDASEP